MLYTAESAANASSRFVGRDHEMEALCRALNETLSGAGRGLLVSAPPGFGKSRLLAEFVLEAKKHHPEIPVLRYSYLPAGTTQESLFRALFRQCRETFLGMAAVKDDCDSIAEKIGVMQPLMHKALHDLAGQQHGGDHRWDSLDNNTRRTLAASVIWDFLNYITAGKPLVLVIEDIHWADGELGFVLQDLATKLKNRKILVALSSRQTEILPDLEKQNFCRIPLGPLSREAQLSYLDATLGVLPGLKPIKDEIIAASEGNPLFLCEMASTLLENSAPQVPLTLKSLIVTRLYALPETQKKHLQQAAAIGLRFNKDLLSSLPGNNYAEIRDTLDNAVKQRLVFREGDVRESYQFSHALIQEAVYESLPGTERKILHSGIFSALKPLLSRHEKIILCAFHTFHAGLHEEAFAYNYLAGSVAVNAADGNASSAFFKNALLSLDKLPADRKNKGRHQVKCHMGLAWALSIQGRHIEARAHIQEAEHLLTKTDLPAFLANRVKTLALFDYWIQGDLVKGIDTGMEILRRLDLKGDAWNYITTAIRTAGMLQDQGRYKDSNAVLSAIQSFFTTDNCGYRYGLLFSAAVLCHAMMSRNYGEIGDLRLASQHAGMCIKFLDRHKNPLSTIYGLSYSSTYLIRAGRYPEALTYFKRAYDVSCQIKSNLLYPFVAAHYGFALCQTGNKEKGFSLMEEACAIARTQAAYGRKALYLQLLAEARLMDKDYKSACDLVDEAISIGTKYQENANIARSYYISGMSCMNLSGRTAESADFLAKARDMAQKINLPPLVASCDSALKQIQAA